jgi:hypothetical protein
MDKLTKRSHPLKEGFHQSKWLIHIIFSGAVHKLIILAVRIILN